MGNQIKILKIVAMATLRLELAFPCDESLAFKGGLQVGNNLGTSGTKHDRHFTLTQASFEYTSFTSFPADYTEPAVCPLESILKHFHACSRFGLNTRALHVVMHSKLS